MKGVLGRHSPFDRRGYHEYHKKVALSFRQLNDKTGVERVTLYVVDRPRSGAILPDLNLNPYY
jgi:hypothetical protein